MRYLLILKEHWLVILTVTLVSTAFAVGLSFIPEQLYESEVDLLIVQKQDDKTDPYTAQKAAETLGNSFINVIYSLDFQNRVFETGKVSAAQFSTSTQQKKKEWEKLVNAQVVPETSIIRIFGYGTEPARAEDIALAVAQVLTTNASDYHGGGDTVAVKQIDGPITSTRTVKPNIPLNGVSAGILAFIAMYSVYIIRLETRRLSEERPFETPKQPAMASQDIVSPFPVEKSPVSYRVLDQFPPSSAAEPTTMHDHLKH